MINSKTKGRCVTLSECPRFKKNFFTKDDFTWIKKNICPDSNNKLVCCEESILLATEEECEIANIDRIVGGNRTAIDQYPFLALLAYEDPVTRKPEFNCGGSLINKR